MARGWESKSVENQMEDREKVPVPPGGNTHPNAQRERELEVLELSRTQLLRELRTIANPRLRAQKQLALTYVEDQIAKFRMPRDSMKS